MYISDNWSEYAVLDTGSGEKLERWGEYLLIRPDPQVIWSRYMDRKLWSKANAHYHRSSKGGGEWEFFNLPDQWQISYALKGKQLVSNKLIFNLKPFNFKHTGLFPEQATNWDWASRLIQERRAEDKEVNVLNLFSYTGAATLSAAASGAKVTHVDSSKGIVSWAKENALSSGLEDAPIRWIVDDCIKFVEREIRRGRKYDAIIMDPPSYGRGPKGEIWKIEDDIYPFIEKCISLLSDEPLFILINSYTTGLQAGVLKTMLQLLLPEHYKALIEADEIALPIEGKDLLLPCGASARCEFRKV